MGYSLLDNGDIPTLSALDKYKNYEITDLLRLPIPKGRKFNEVKEVSENTIFVSFDDLKTFEKDLSVLSRILRDGKTDIVFESYSREFKGSIRSYNQKVKKLLKRLQEHENTKRDGEYHKKALRNTVVQGIFDVITDPINQVNLQKPISMDEQQAAGSRSNLGKEEKYMTFDNPATKFKMQIQNMVGREVIGVTATSLKAFFAASLYYDTEAIELSRLLKSENIENNTELIWTKLKDLTFDAKLSANPKKTELRTLSNVYLRPVLAEIYANPNLKRIKLAQADPNQNIETYVELLGIKNSQEHLMDYITVNVETGEVYLELQTLIEDLNERANRNDAPMGISGLLSAATDFFVAANSVLKNKFDALKNFYIFVY